MWTPNPPNLSVPSLKSVKNQFQSFKMKKNNMLSKNTKIKADTKDIKVMEWEMEKVGFITNKEAITMANGKITICMVMANSIIQIRS
jgi:hypothetical protein